MMRAGRKPTRTEGGRTEDTRPDNFTVCTVSVTGRILKQVIKRTPPFRYRDRRRALAGRNSLVQRAKPVTERRIAAGQRR